MLQFLTHHSDRFSIAEEAQMAIEGGCRWIQITSSTDPGMTLKDTALSVKALCEENEAFLIIDHDVELVNELRIHGVHLADGDMKPREARELLGPHAVIGVDVSSAEEILGLKGIDVDYCVLRPFSKRLLLEDYRKIIEEVREKGCELPVVAAGEIAVEDIVALREAGVSGVAVSSAIIDAADPVATTRTIISRLVDGQ